MKKNQNNIVCTRMIQRICADLDEDITSPLCTEIKLHLQKCPKCCAYVDSIKKTVYFYKNLIDEDVPCGVDYRLWKVLKLDKPK